MEEEALEELEDGFHLPITVNAIRSYFKNKFKAENENRIRQLEPTSKTCQHYLAVTNNLKVQKLRLPCGMDPTLERVAL